MKLLFGNFHKNILLHKIADLRKCTFQFVCRSFLLLNITSIYYIRDETEKEVRNANPFYLCLDYTEIL